MIGDPDYPAKVALRERELAESIERLDWRACESPYHHDPEMADWHEGDAYYLVHVLHHCGNDRGPEIQARCRRVVDRTNAVIARNGFGVCAGCLTVLPRVYQVLEVIGK